MSNKNQFPSKIFLLKKLWWIYFSYAYPIFAANIYVTLYVDIRVFDYTSTQWGRDRMIDTWQMPFSNTFSWMKIVVFWLEFHWRLFPSVQLTIFSMGSDNGLALVSGKSFIWTNDGLVYWRIYASIGPNEWYTLHYGDVIMDAIASQITRLAIVYSIGY